ncbi:MAG: outer membrane beta-barrel protein [Prevotella sp.]|nr:outer membrane beta-barrel protein [Prevotella sp.]
MKEFYKFWLILSLLMCRMTNCVLSAQDNFLNFSVGTGWSNISFLNKPLPSSMNGFNISAGLDFNINQTPVCLGFSFGYQAVYDLHRSKDSDTDGNLKLTSLMKSSEQIHSLPIELHLSYRFKIPKTSFSIFPFVGVGMNNILKWKYSEEASITSELKGDGPYSARNGVIVLKVNDLMPYVLPEYREMVKELNIPDLEVIKQGKQVLIDKETDCLANDMRFVDGNSMKIFRHPLFWHVGLRFDFAKHFGAKFDFTQSFKFRGSGDNAYRQFSVSVFYNLSAK